MSWYNFRKVLLGVTMAGILPSMGQEIPRDTSYTLESALEKIQKNFPTTGACRPVTDREGVVISADLVYRIIGSRELRADLYRPAIPDADVLPAVLFIHGGGWRTGDKKLMADLAIALSKSGYVVMTPEYRLSLEAQFPAAVMDLKAALKWMRSHADDWSVDPDRIAVIGCSAGGQLAALVGNTGDHPEFEEEPDLTTKVQAIVDIDGVLAFHHPESEEGSMAAQWLGGSYNEAPEVWEKASALNYVDGNTPPTLFIASAYPRFLAGRNDYIEKAKQYGIVTETRFMENAPHSFWLFDPWFEPTIEEIRNFLELNLE